MKELQMLSRQVTIFMAGLTGTAAMTACSYFASGIAGQNFREPELLAGAASRWLRTGNPVLAGWLLHVAFGLGWALPEVWVVEKTHGGNRLFQSLGLGILSGAIAVLCWKLLFRLSPDQPDTSKHRFYRNLILAHIVYTLTVTRMAQQSAAPQASGSETHAFAASNSPSLYPRISPWTTPLKSS